MLRLHTTESRRPAARFATPTQGKTNGRPYERSSRKQRIEPLKTQIPNLSTAKVVKSSKEAKHQGRRVEALPCAETSSPAQMIERKEQPPARNRESRQTTTTAESGGGGLVSVFAPPYGEDAPPAFHRYENAKTWTRGANHRNERGETWTRERGERLNAAQTAAVCSSFVVYFATLQARAPYEQRGKDRAAPKGQSLNAARRMVEAGRVFCPPRVQCSPPARKPETAAPPRVFVWPCFGRISKIQKFNILRRNKTTFATVFGRFWRVFGRVLDVFGQRAKECSRAAETARRVCQLTNTKRPALFLLWRHTRRGFCVPFGSVFPTKR